jgi:hypothetical protein
MGSKTHIWGVHRIWHMVGSKNEQTVLPSGRWVRAVPLPYYGNSLRAAWEVLMGRAYAVAWPEPGEFEEARDAE